jgi:hypothetical protein
MFKVYTDGKTVRFRRLVDWDARYELAAQLQRGSAVRGVVDDTGHRKT